MATKLNNLISKNFLYWHLLKANFFRKNLFLTIAKTTKKICEIGPAVFNRWITIIYLHRFYIHRYNILYFLLSCVIWPLNKSLSSLLFVLIKNVIAFIPKNGIVKRAIDGVQWVFFCIPRNSPGGTENGNTVVIALLLFANIRYAVPIWTRYFRTVGGYDYTIWLGDFDRRTAAISVQKETSVRRPNNTVSRGSGRRRRWDGRRSRPAKRCASGPQ